MAFVIDASLAAAWFLPDEATERSLRAMEIVAQSKAFVPHLWWFEIRNVFVVNERRKRITQAVTDPALELLAQLPVETDTQPAEPEIFRLARQHDLTVYDAAYLELASRRALKLASLDRALIGAARRERVELLDF